MLKVANLAHAVEPHREVRRDVAQALPRQRFVVVIVVAVITVPPLGEMGELPHRQTESHRGRELAP